MWGGNYHGQLGDGTYIDKNVPIDITTQFNLNPGTAPKTSCSMKLLDKIDQSQETARSNWLNI